MLLNERGIALPLTLLIVLVVVSVALGLLAVAGHEPAISKNLAESTQARFAAEAGIEAAFDKLATTTDWSTLISQANAQTGLQQLFTAKAIGSLPLSHGKYDVAVRNDNRATDPPITGVATDLGGLVSDTNKVLIITSTGTTPGTAGVPAKATRRIRVVVKKLAIPPGMFPGAVNFPGNEAQTYFNGTSFSVDGRGYKMDGTRDMSCPSILGIAVSPVLGSPPGSNEGLIETTLSAAQLLNVWGKSQLGGLDLPGINTIAANSSLTPTLVKNFIDQAKNSADIVLNSDQPNGISISNIGSTCTTDPKSQSCWGYKDGSGQINPKVVYVKGSPDPTSLFTALNVSGTSTGYGVLIVEDGDFKINGNFTWNGAIIVTGQYVGLGFMGGGTQTVYGSVISNETATDPGFKEGWVTGNVQIRNSCEALAAAMDRNRRLTTIISWKDLAPNE